MPQLVPEILSRLPLCGFPGKNSQGCSKPCFVVEHVLLVLVNGLQMFTTYKSFTIGDSKKKKNYGPSVSLINRKVRFTCVCSVANSQPASWSLCYLPTVLSAVNLVFTSLTFLGKRGNVLPFSQFLCSLKSLAGLITWWAHLIWALWSLPLRMGHLDSNGEKRWWSGGLSMLSMNSQFVET